MGKRYFMLLVAACVAFTMTTLVRAEDVGQPPLEYVLHKGLSYSDADPVLTLDLFLPRDAVRPMPCVLVIQGGGFKGQDSQGFRPFAEFLVKNGFAAALVGYRGRPDHRYQETVSEIKAAVRYLRKVSSDYDIDPEKIGAMGRSAGATLAMLLAVSDGVEGFEDLAGEEGVFSSRIQAVVGIAGVYDFVARFTDKGQMVMQPNLETKRRTNGEWIGSPFSATDEHWRRASAINHIEVTDPPVLLLHSRDDSTVPWMQSKEMYEKLTQAGIVSEIEITDEGGHGGPATAKESMVTFLRKVLTGESAGENEGKPLR